MSSDPFAQFMCAARSPASARVTIDAWSSAPAQRGSRALRPPALAWFVESTREPPRARTGRFTDPLGLLDQCAPSVASPCLADPIEALPRMLVVARPESPGRVAAALRRVRADAGQWAAPFLAASALCLAPLSAYAVSLRVDLVDRMVGRPSAAAVAPKDAR